MAFSQSSRNIRIEDSLLYADCLKEDNRTWVPAEINLDSVIGNINGSFQWGKQAFSQSARDIHLEENSTLAASLANEVGTYGPDQTVNLDDHIANINGHLEYQ
ncbi:Cyanovirin-N [Dactylonectria estremocensis]|uniref:Cyanovirin-N n=1 Tax=Dactylonectria estremocensis TaxID=1079267 RepID=A0A9P9JKF2_9HYPO|nr:Cyanovirin-N [Dactylonectria estremocensis]